MFEVLLFSLSISIDAFGYSFGFGTKNIKVYKKDFLILNLINTLILSLFLALFSRLIFLLKYPIINQIGPILLVFYGWYNIFLSFKAVFKENIVVNKVNNCKFKTKSINYFCWYDLLFLLLVFIIENLISTIIFYSEFNNIFLFIFSNFIFNYLFFSIGFDLGSKIIKKIKFDTSIISGCIFVLLGIFGF